MLTESAAAIARALESKDCYTFQHSERVARYAVLIARAINLSQEFQEHIRLSGLLHDVGKIGIPDSVLNKAGALSEREWEIIKSHPQTGYDILVNISEPVILQGILEHHERIDGSGYPGGKKKEEISLAGRIIGVADTFDALTTDRPYRAGKTKEEALLIIRELAGKQLDSRIVNVFLELDELKKAFRVSYQSLIKVTQTNRF